MIKAVLFDLDGTLLDSDMDIFMPHYFRALSAALAPVIPAETLMAALIASTRAMMASRGRRPETNHDRFWADFLPRVGGLNPELERLLDDFYRREFGKLQRYTAVKPEARLVVQSAFSAGLKVAIATQPVFPRPAVQHRLQWANLLDFPFALVTTYENMHTTKPDPAYYLEICDAIACEPAACLMVGNDLEADIRPAAAAGLRTFWLAEHAPSSASGAPSGPAGTLADVQRIILAL